MEVVRLIGSACPGFTAIVYFLIQRELFPCFHPARPRLCAD